jgi:serine phosphatase RsbU (regulator of sigma subunit)
MRLGERCPAALLDMGPGDVLVLLSDGVFEARNAVGEPFGEERVRALVRESAGQGSMQELAAALLQAVLAFAGDAPQEDDMTLLLIEREATR